MSRLQFLSLFTIFSICNGILELPTSRQLQEVPIVPAGMLMNTEWTCAHGAEQCNNNTNAFWLLTLKQLDNCRITREVTQLKWDLDIDMDCAAREWSAFHILVAPETSVPITCDTVDQSPPGGVEMLQHCDQDNDLLDIRCGWSCPAPEHEGLAPTPILACSIEIDRHNKFHLKEDHVAQCKIVDGDCEGDTERHRLVCTGYDLDDVLSHSPYDNPIPAVDHNVYLCTAVNEWECLFCHAHLDSRLEAIQPACPNAKIINGLYGPACYAGDEEQVCYQYKHEEGHTDCMGAWGPWTVCDSRCTQYQMYNVEKEATGTGYDCPYKDHFVRKKDCQHGLCAAQGCSDDARMGDVTIDCELVQFAKLLLPGICDDALTTVESWGFSFPKNMEDKGQMTVSDLCPLYCDQRGSVFWQQEDEDWYEDYVANGGRVAPECQCSSSGVVLDIDTNRPGCAHHRAGDAAFCYVVDPLRCGIARPSAQFQNEEKLTWRDCDVELEGDFEGPCSCSQKSFMNGVDTGAVGCGYHRDDLLHPYCYVDDSDKCNSDHARESVPFAQWNLKWRRCVTDKVPDFLEPHPSVDHIIMSCDTLALGLQCEATVKDLLAFAPSLGFPKWFPTNYPNNPDITVREICPVSCGICTVAPGSSLSVDIKPLQSPQLPWVQEEKLGETPKPVDCQGNWTLWSKVKCSDDFKEEEQIQERQFRPEIWAANGGNDCEVEPFTMEERPCKKQTVPIERKCDAEWVIVEPCSARCIKTLEYEVKEEAGGGCFFRDLSRQSAPCQDGEGNCLRIGEAVDCVAKGWIPLGDCDPASCTQEQEYQIETRGSGSGKQCPTVEGVKRRVGCKSVDKCHCHGQWTVWTQCTRRDDGLCKKSSSFVENGGGVTRSSPTCHVHAEIGDVLNTPCSTDGCNQDADCVGDWETTTQCDKDTCQSMMTFKVESPRHGLGEACPHSHGRQDLRTCDNKCIGSIPTASYGTFTINLAILTNLQSKILANQTSKELFAEEMAEAFGDAAEVQPERFNIYRLSEDSSGVLLKVQVVPATSSTDVSAATIIMELEAQLEDQDSELRNDLEIAPYLRRSVMDTPAFSTSDDLKVAVVAAEECQGRWSEWDDRECWTHQGTPSIRREWTGVSDNCKVETTWEERPCPFASAKDVSCSGSFIDTTDCNSECVKKTEFRVDSSPQGSGKSCPFIHGEELGAPCRCEKENDENRDCVSKGWVPLGHCNADCQVSEEYQVTTPSGGNGKLCPFEHGSRRTGHCNEKECIPSCSGDWSSWSQCSRDSSKKCTQRSEFQISRPAMKGGHKCHYEAGTNKFKDCDENNCQEDVDCEGRFIQTEECHPIECMADSRFDIFIETQGGGLECRYEADSIARRPCSDCQSASPSSYALLTIRMTPEKSLQNSVFSSKESQKAFSQKLEQVLADSLHQPVERFHVYEVRVGSVIAEVQIIPWEEEQTGGSPAELVVQIANQMVNPASKMREDEYFGDFSETAAVMGIQYTNSKYVVKGAAPTPLTRDDEYAYLPSTIAIVVSMISVLAFLAFVIACIVCCRRNRKTHSTKQLFPVDRPLPAATGSAKINEAGWWNEEDKKEEEENNQSDAGTSVGVRTLGKTASLNSSPQAESTESRRTSLGGLMTRAGSSGDSSDSQSDQWNVDSAVTEDCEAPNNPFLPTS